MASDLRQVMEQLKAVSHPLRLRVLALLAAGELCVCQVAAILGVAPSTASEAIKELRRAGLVTERREGRWVFVSLVAERRTTSLLLGLLAEVEGLETVREDRSRARAIQSVPVATLCGKPHSPAAEEA